MNSTNLTDIQQCHEDTLSSLYDMMKQIAQTEKQKEMAIEISIGTVSFALVLFSFEYILNFAIGVYNRRKLAKNSKRLKRPSIWTFMLNILIGIIVSVFLPIGMFANSSYKYICSEPSAFMAQFSKEDSTFLIRTLLIVSNLYPILAILLKFVISFIVVQLVKYNFVKIVVYLLSLLLSTYIFVYEIPSVIKCIREYPAYSNTFFTTETLFYIINNVYYLIILGIFSCILLQLLVMVPMIIKRLAKK